MSKNETRLVGKPSWEMSNALDKHDEIREAIIRLRKQVNSDIAQLSQLLQSLDFKQARCVFAKLRTYTLTTEESSQVIASLESFPEDERPVFYGNKRRLFWAESLDKAYGTQIEAMTHKEFEAFAREAGTGRRQQTGEYCDASYVFLIMSQNNYPETTMLSVLAESVDERLKRLKGVEDEHRQSFPESYMLQQSLAYLSSVKHPDATKKILEFARYVMTQKLYDKRMESGDDWGTQHKFLGLLSSAIDALTRSVRQIPDNLSAIEDLDELLAWQTKLQQYLFHGDSVRSLQEIIEMIEMIEQQISHTSNN